MRVQERCRACNAPIAKRIVVDVGAAHLREAESVQRTCSQTESSGKGRCMSVKGGERAMHL